MLSTSQATETAKPNWWVVLEVLAFSALAFGTRPLFAMITWKFAGPLSLLFTLTVLTIYMRRKGIGWHQMGFAPLPGWKAKAMILPKALGTFVLFCLAVAIVLLGGEAIGLVQPDGLPDGAQDRWGDVEGNLPMLLLWLGVVWTSAAFGEEMFFRGYMVTRIEDGLGGLRGRTALAIAIPALIFGFAHFYYQGLWGFLMTGMIGLAFGVAFVLFKRNLWPIILVHGTIDTINFVSVYRGEA